MHYRIIEVTGGSQCVSVIVNVAVIVRCCRKRRKQQLTTVAMRRGARKPWQPVVKSSSSVDGSVILLD